MHLRMAQIDLSGQVTTTEAILAGSGIFRGPQHQEKGPNVSKPAEIGLRSN